MRLTPTQLRAQYDRVMRDWPWILDVEEDCNLPPFLLIALGSRETNLRDVVGDGGHGHGIWQRDDRSFTIPSPYPLQQQAVDAGNLLRSHYVAYRPEFKGTALPLWRAAVCAYNAGRQGVRNAIAAGQTPDSATTGGDYGDDVLNRWGYLTYWGWDLL